MSKPGLSLVRRLAGAWRIGVGLLVVIAVGAGLIGWRTYDRAMEARLMAAEANEILEHKDLVRYAARVARPIYARACAGCHGEDMKGGKGSGAPNLTDPVTLFPDTVFHTERILLYGVRAGHSKALYEVEMPAYGQRGQITPSDIEHLVQFMLKMSSRPHDDDAAELGRQVYAGAAVCSDCHGGEGEGNPDYGAPSLNANIWDYGGDPQSLYNSVYFGRHGMMPAFIGKLSLAQIRALAVYVHAKRKP